MEKILELLELLVEEMRDFGDALERLEHAQLMDDRPMNRKEAAEYLGLHPQTVYTWAREGLIAYSVLGGNDTGERGEMRFLRSDLDVYLKKMRVPTLEERK